MNHYTLSANCPAMRGALANDIKTVARNTIEHANEYIKYWQENDSLYYDVEEGEGSVNICGTIALGERGEWRDVGDEIICVRFYEPDIEDVNLMVELFNEDGEPVDNFNVNSIKALERLADMISVDDLCVKMEDKGVYVSYKPSDCCRKCWTLDGVKNALGVWFDAVLGFISDGISYTPVLVSCVQREWDEQLQKFYDSKRAFCARYGSE